MLTVRVGSAKARGSPDAVAKWQAAVAESPESESPAPSPDGARILSTHTAACRAAGTALGLGRKATTGELRRALVAGGHRELVREWESIDKGRRAPAHPEDRFVERLVAAVGQSPPTVPCSYTDDEWRLWMDGGWHAHQGTDVVDVDVSSGADSDGSSSSDERL